MLPQKSGQQLKNGHLYQYEIDTLTSDEWSTELQKFDDASIFQTTGYSECYPGGQNSNKFILKRNGEIRALALVRKKRIPYFNGGFAYIYWGPVWQLHNEPMDQRILLHTLQSLYTEFVLKQKMYLRITPSFREGEVVNVFSLIKQAGFSFRKYGKKYNTILIDLKNTLEELRKNFRRNWRNHLNRAERNDLDIRCGVDMDLYSVFMRLSDEMYKRKKFLGRPDIHRFQTIQANLSSDEKMRIFICLHRNKPISSAVVSVVGNTAYYLLGAMSTEGMHFQGSYLIQWHILQWLKSFDCKWYDLCGIDPQKNPGVYHFKSGMGGDELSYVRQMHAYQNKILFSIIISAEIIRNFITWILSYLNKFHFFTDRKYSAQS